jgi:hypothetical protein
MYFFICKLCAMLSFISVCGGMQGTQSLAFYLPGEHSVTELRAQSLYQ